MQSTTSNAIKNVIRLTINIKLTAQFRPPTIWP